MTPQQEYAVSKLAIAFGWDRMATADLGVALRNCSFTTSFTELENPAMLTIEQAAAVGSLTLAKTIADNPSAASFDQLSDAKAFFLWTKNIGNASARRLNYTDREIRELLIVLANKNLGNWKARREAIRAKGIKPPGRTWFIQWLPVEAARRGISI